ncbi:MAG: hypothetical protein A2176_09275 [Spirochaetes bacterium RBG_13_51_14]|nr:MAG: hypothetical protein A2176_09275 [Spirochaetes bacterium RBG_13_51_14]
MKKRTHYVIDKKYQLRTAFSIIGTVILITAVILGAITASVVYNNIRLNWNNERIDNIYKIENSIFSLLSSTPSPSDQALKKAIEESSEKHDANMATLDTIIAYNNRIIAYNKFLLIAILFIVMAECALLFIFLIRRTHRVSGPIHVMSNFMKDIIEGREPALRPLRKKDELKDFYELFKQMLSALEYREKKKP